MGDTTKIEWAHKTFNGWVGCTKVSPACDHCYAEVWAKYSGMVKWGPGEPRRMTSPANWRKPLKWQLEAEQTGQRFRVFANSLADVFDGEVSISYREKLFGLAPQTPNLDWLFLSKRLHIAQQYMASAVVARLFDQLPPPNIWIGATVENRKMAELRIPLLRETSAAKRFLSVEPLLEDLGVIDLTGIDWVICGGESGKGARPMHPDWARSLRDQCQAAGVPFFFKQWGEWVTELQSPEDITLPGECRLPWAGDETGVFRVSEFLDQGAQNGKCRRLLTALLLGEKLRQRLESPHQRSAVRTERLPMGMLGKHGV